MNYEYERVATPAGGLRLHLNENTAGCSPAVTRVLGALTPRQLATYPDYDAAIDSVARRLHVDAESLILTNGLDEGILAASIAAFRRGADDGDAVVVVPAFDMYAACSDVLGGRIREVPLGPDFVFPLDDVIAAVTARTKIVWLTNPNNPTGQSIPRQAIARIAEAAAGALIFVDEAYVDFGGTTLIGDPLLKTHPQIVVGRTFAKAYGLAGLRAGAVVSNPATLARLRRATPPYSLNICAAVALPAAMEDRAHYDWYVDQVAQSKSLLYDNLGRLGVTFWPSDANFVLARFDGAAARIARDLAAAGVHVRDRSRDRGCADCLRITAGVLEHTREFLAALEAVL